ncbi:MAG TPA: tRNA (adenosine(37)-N6)-threonylcarbamoyltransferase complex dimerization subunit type 1 TsaB [Candidatus Binatia bacterium]|jgi:tRNA threonylcarbamoyladenosine biosynthesis protein TsaB
MIILGIDTATAAASAALLEDGKLISEATGGGDAIHRSNHAQNLLPLIDRLLDSAGVRLADISALAVAIGPGSFTGLRIGLSTVKGLTYGSEVPVVGIPTLAAVAARVDDREGLICPFLDARKKEVYAALFERRDGTLERVSEDLVCRPEEVVDFVRLKVANGTCLFIGDAAAAYADAITQGLGGRAVLTMGDRYPSTAAAVARLAEEKIRRQEYDPVGPLSPLYLRPSEAELKRNP